VAAVDVRAPCLPSLDSQEKEEKKEKKKKNLDDIRFFALRYHRYARKSTHFFNMGNF
jgi:hypothetical protein